MLSGNYDSPNSVPDNQVGYFPFAQSENSTILHTEDGGGTWNSQTSGTGADLLSVAFAKS